MDIDQQIKAIELEMAKTPYHKATQKWFGKMRAKIAKLRAQQADRQVKKSGGGGGGFGLKKFGNATVVLVGFPSVGKSTLLNKLTNANSPTAEYAFTTVSVIPGMMNYNGAQIQILDVPGLIEGASRGSGRGREVLSVVRGADLLLLIAEAGREKSQFTKIETELDQNGVRINEARPQVVVHKTLRGGMKINSTTTQELLRETIVEVAREFGIINAEITLRENLTIERLIDAFAPNRVHVPALYLVNKVDMQSRQVGKLDHLPGGTDSPPGVIKISAEKEMGLDELREAVWGILGLVRVYLRPVGTSSGHLEGGRTKTEPLIMHAGQKLKDVLETVSRDMAQDKKEAKIWGPGARFPGQTVSFEIQIQDGMEVTFV
ncbi:MAG: 50S ribosome-binding GTPase [Candidatus Blackburnbacteria bacterium]|nr:50S ribosome-binding GTPase [Candidatus Blackburnbacteria bacterium]